VKKSPAQLDREIAEALSTPAQLDAEIAGKSKARKPRVVAHPKTTGETVIEVPDPLGSSYRRTFRLRPAETKTNYERGYQTMMAKSAKRTDDTWFVLTKSGMYVGILQEGSGSNPWNVYKLRQERGAISQSGEEVGASIRDAETRQDAVARGWWNT
jgi:hypothetical protein